MKRVLTVIAVLALVASVPVAFGADFNGDGTNDIGIFRASSGLWAIRGVTRVYFGSSGDEPEPGDYNGDGVVDIGLFRPASGLWAVRDVTRAYFGGSGDEPLAGIPAGGGGGLWSPNGDDIYYNSGYVSIGGQNPRYPLDIYKGTSDHCYLRFTNTTTGTGSGSGVLVGLDPNEDFRIHSYEENNIEFYINNSQKVIIESGGDVGIGTEDPYEKLHVRDESSGWFVAMFENIADSSTSDLIRLRINKNHPGTGNEYLTFYQDVGSIGAIRGNGGGGVELYSAGSDFAEYLPRLNLDEEIGAGDLVGLRGGKISKNTSGVEQIRIISTAPIVLGNSPGKENEHFCEKVAFTGQVPARVRGKVQAGDYIVPSGLNDGTGMAIPPGKLTSAHCSQIVGRAWQSSGVEGVKLIDTSVGLQASAQALQEMALRKDKKIAELCTRLEALERMVKELTQ